MNDLGGRTINGPVDGAVIGNGTTESTAYAVLREGLWRELPAAQALRRELHAAPRLSGQEGPTRARLLDALPAGTVEHVAGTGAVLRVGGPGPAVGVRGELDALPLVERTGVEWAAGGGAMHACGHDVHLAAVVALARTLDRLGADPPLLVVLQPREEGFPSGASDVVASGALHRHRVGAMIGAHVQPLLAEGVVASVPGAVNASSDEFRVVVRGAEGHAAYPHLTRDPVVAMAQVIVTAQQVVSRSADPMMPTVVTFGTVNAGTAPNAVPGEAVARGTLRAMSEAWRQELHERFTQVVEDVARACGCVAEVTILPGEPVLVNDAGLAVRAGGLLREQGWTVDGGLRSCGADDFSHYASVAPSLMMFVGVDTAAGLHSPEFLPGDAAVGAVAESLLAGYLAAASALPGPAGVNGMLFSRNA
ncbi:M20 family metallopeptidase [Nonomuraea sp. NPDC047529]|uniref:M20 metallopeptidase family protein n=1 Tax=Nonomuraea sp. NPDC047529 TaxID=3155623 RepID=UPI0033F3B384